MINLSTYLLYIQEKVGEAMNKFANIEKWVQDQWKGSKLGDARRNARTIKLATSLINKPDASLPTQMGNWGDLKAAYRLLNSSHVNHQTLQEKHWQNVRQLAEENKHNTVLFIQDESAIDYSSKKSTKGLGPIGNHAGRGIMIHSTLAVACSENTSILGLAHQNAWIRADISRKRTETRAQRKQRWNEADNWEDSLKKIGTPPSDARWINVGDRGNDIFTFMRFSKNNGWQYVIRAKYDRNIEIGNGQKIRLFDYIRRLAPQTSKEIQLRTRNDDQARTVKLNVAWVQIRNTYSKKSF